MRNVIALGTHDTLTIKSECLRLTRGQYQSSSDIAIFPLIWSFHGQGIIHPLHPAPGIRNLGWGIANIDNKKLTTNVKTLREQVVLRAWNRPGLLMDDIADANLGTVRRFEFVSSKGNGFIGGRPQLLGGNPQEAGEYSHDNSCERSNGSVVGLQKLPNTSKVISEHDVEVGSTFVRGLISIVIFGIAYAILKALGCGNDPPKQTEKKDH